METAPHQHATRVALGLGANLGDPRANIAAAVDALRAGGVTDLRLSRLILTAPVDCEPGTPPFTNAAATGRWNGSALELMQLCKQIETQLGRPAAHSQREARVIDIDILLFGDRAVAEERLRIPHPRLRERRFALEPLAELAPDWPMPPDGMTVRAALEALNDG